MWLVKEILYAIALVAVLHIVLVCCWKTGIAEACDVVCHCTPTSVFDWVTKLRLEGEDVKKACGLRLEGEQVKRRRRHVV